MVRRVEWTEKLCIPALMEGILSGSEGVRTPIGELHLRQDAGSDTLGDFVVRFQGPQVHCAPLFCISLHRCASFGMPEK